jgi:hypothetical protein
MFQVHVRIAPEMPTPHHRRQVRPPRYSRRTAQVSAPARLVPSWPEPNPAATRPARPAPATAREPAPGLGAGPPPRAPLLASLIAPRPAAPTSAPDAAPAPPAAPSPATPRPDLAQVRRGPRLRPPPRPQAPGRRRSRHIRHSS